MYQCDISSDKNCTHLGPRHGLLAPHEGLLLQVDLDQVPVAALAAQLVLEAAFRRDRAPEGNCMKIGLPGKSILGDYRVIHLLSDSDRAEIT